MKQGIAAKARELVEKAVTDAGFTIWDVRFEKDGGDWSLVFELDKGDNMSMEDCELANGIIEPVIDAADPINGPYVLEVSSAGLTRLLRTDYHFSCAAEKGWDVKAHLFRPVSGAKELNGKLVSFDSESVNIGGTVCERKNISRAEAILG